MRLSAPGLPKALLPGEKGIPTKHLTDEKQQKAIEGDGK